MNYEVKEIESTKSIYNQFKMKLEVACFSNGYIPKHIILDRTRNIHSYLVFIYRLSGKFYCRYFSAKTNPIDDIIEILKIQYSKLDRPLFFIFQDELNNFNVIEGTELKELFIEQKLSNVDSLERIYQLSYCMKDAVLKIKSEL